MEAESTTSKPKLTFLPIFLQALRIFKSNLWLAWVPFLCSVPVLVVQSLRLKANLAADPPFDPSGPLFRHPDVPSLIGWISAPSVPYGSGSILIFCVCVVALIVSAVARVLLKKKWLAEWSKPSLALLGVVLVQLLLLYAVRFSFAWRWDFVGRTIQTLALNTILIPAGLGALYFGLWGAAFTYCLAYDKPSCRELSGRAARAFFPLFLFFFLFLILKSIVIRLVPALLPGSSFATGETFTREIILFLVGAVILYVPYTIYLEKVDVVDALHRGVRLFLKDKYTALNLLLLWLLSSFVLVNSIYFVGNYFNLPSHISLTLGILSSAVNYILPIPFVLSIFLIVRRGNSAPDIAESQQTPALY